MSDPHVQDKEVAGIIENVFSKFKSMLVNKDERSKASLDSQLRKIDQHLADKGHRYCSLEGRGDFTQALVDYVTCTTYQNI